MPLPCAHNRRMNEADLQLAGALGHEATDKRLDILRRIGEVHSISEAARSAGVSYKAAWQAVETLSNLAGAALVEKMVGGSGGGGAVLTPAGERLLRAADLLVQARGEVMARLDRETEMQQSVPGIAALGLRTSMRNQLPCRVQALRGRSTWVRVELALADGAPLFSRITRESAQLLGLARGQPVLALCKATAVAISPNPAEAEGMNCLTGEISRISRGKKNAEVSLRLTSGLQLVGFAAMPDGLGPRATAYATVEESGVVIALPG